MNKLASYFSILLLVLFASNCGEKIEPGTSTQTPPVIKNVKVQTARMTEQPVFYEAVGTVRAGIKSNLDSKLLGTIEDIRVREGDRVKKGDTLLIIDQRQVKAGVRQAEAGLSEAKEALAAAISGQNAAKAEEELALTTYKRYLTLKEKKLVSVQAFDEVEARYLQAKAATKKALAMVDAANARVRQAEAALSAVQVTRKDAVITAPYDGIISGKMVDEGDLAKPGSPLLVLETIRGFCVDMILPETYIDYVQARQKVTVKVPALQTGPLEGTVCTIVPSADQRSRSFLVKINLPIDLNVRSGMFARVLIPTGHSSKVLINKEAVVHRGQLTGLYIINSQNIAHFRLLRLGKTFGDSIEVLSGLKEGDRYVKTLPPKISDGARVEVAS